MTEGKQEETMPARGVFNPHEHLIQLKSKQGDQDYLPVQWRLVWINEQCPALKITIVDKYINPELEVEKEVYQWNSETRRSEKTLARAKGYAWFHVRVEDGKGKVGEATKTETAVDFPDYAEKADTGATGRALAKIGYGTQFVGDEFDEGVLRIVDAPVDRSPAPTTAAAAKPPQVSAVQASKPASTTPTPAAKPAPPAAKPVEASLDIEVLLERMDNELGLFERKRFLEEIGLDPEIDLRIGYVWNKVSYAMVRDGFNTWLKSDKRQQWLAAPAETKHMLYILSGSTGIISELIKSCGGKEQGIQTLNAIRDGDKDMVGLKFKDNPAFTGRLADRYIGYYKCGHLTGTGQFLVDVPEEFKYKKAA